jgi:hypothetical protein
MRVQTSSERPAAPVNLPPLDPRVLEGIALFNRQEYFDAHEAIEAAWMEEFGPARGLYQGLIQTAVALHHFCQRNRPGAVKLYHSSRDFLQPYGSVCQGIHLGELAAEMDRLFLPVVYGMGFPEDGLPTIKLDASHRGAGG